MDFNFQVQARVNELEKEITRLNAELPSALADAERNTDPVSGPLYAAAYQLKLKLLQTLEKEIATLLSTQLVHSGSESDAKLADVSDAKLAGVSDAKLPGESDAKLAGESDAKLPGESDAKLAGESDAKLAVAGESDAKLAGESDAKLAGVSKSESDGESDDKSDGESDSEFDGESDSESDGKSNGESKLFKEDIKEDIIGFISFLLKNYIWTLEFVKILQKLESNRIKKIRDFANVEVSSDILAKVPSSILATINQRFAMRGVLYMVYKHTADKEAIQLISDLLTKFDTVLERSIQIGRTKLRNSDIYTTECRKGKACHGRGCKFEHWRFPFHFEGMCDSILALLNVPEHVQNKRNSIHMYADDSRATDRPGSDYDSRATDRPGSDYDSRATDRPGSDYDSRASDCPGSAYDSRASDCPGSAYDSRASDCPGSAYDSRASDYDSRATDRLGSAYDSRASDYDSRASDRLGSAYDSRASDYDSRASDRLGSAYDSRASDRPGSARLGSAYDSRASNRLGSAYDSLASDRNCYAPNEENRNAWVCKLHGKKVEHLNTHGHPSANRESQNRQRSDSAKSQPPNAQEIWRIAVAAQNKMRLENLEGLNEMARLQE
jgi:hypothetical protein